MRLVVAVRRPRRQRVVGAGGLAVDEIPGRKEAQLGHVELARGVKGDLLIARPSQRLGTMKPTTPSVVATRIVVMNGASGSINRNPTMNRTKPRLAFVATKRV